MQPCILQCFLRILLENRVQPGVAGKLVDYFAQNLKEICELVAYFIFSDFSDFTLHSNALNILNKLCKLILTSSDVAIKPKDVNIRFSQNPLQPCILQCFLRILLENRVQPGVAGKSVHYCIYALEYMIFLDER